MTCARMGAPLTSYCFGGALRRFGRLERRRRSSCCVQWRFAGRSTIQVSPVPVELFACRAQRLVVVRLLRTGKVSLINFHKTRDLVGVKGCWLGGRNHRAVRSSPCDFEPFCRIGFETRRCRTPPCSRMRVGRQRRSSWFLAARLSLPRIPRA